ncbi:hypothetical protein [Psychrobacter sp. JCM 18900]|uniref:hypothetical protein n=1 Tax=Psychrobacter sp. JCM 18900 TaxID=1298608 RepID=UPI0004B1382A|nr:hypothetical protein [Psychrobacter sp. JCM 18900]
MPRPVLLSREPFKSTLTKQSTWPSTHSYYESLRAQRAYKRISDEHLQVFAEQSLSKNTDGSYTLMFAPEQELANYFGAPHIDTALKKTTLSLYVDYREAYPVHQWQSTKAMAKICTR